MTWFRFLVAGYTVSAFGSNLNMVAVGLYAYLVTGSPLHTGLFMALRVAAGFLAGLAAGPLVTRLPRKRIMVTADLVQSTAMLSLALLPAAAAVGPLYGVAVATGACHTLTTVSLRSGVPAMVGQSARVRANGMLVSARAVAMVAGFAAAGILVGSIGYTAVFSITAATFALSAANLSWLPVLASVPGPQRQPGERRSSLALAAAAFQAAPLLAAMVAVRAGDALGSASHIVGLPVYATIIEPAAPAVFLSQFWTAWAVGMLLAQQLVTRLAGRRPGAVNEWSFTAATIAMSALFIGAFAGLTGIGLMFVALLAGLADGYTETAYLSRLQTVSDDRRGPMFGMVAMVEQSSLGIGMVVAAGLLQAFPPPLVAVAMHGFAILLGLSLLTLLVVRRLGQTPAAEPSQWPGT